RGLLRANGERVSDACLVDNRARSRNHEGSSLGVTMQNGNQGLGGTRWRSLLVAAVATVGTLWTSVAMATITQGDFSVFGFFETRGFRKIQRLKSRPA